MIYLRFILFTLKLIIFFLVAPEIIQPLNPSIELIEGEKLDLQSIIVGNPTPSITWIKNKVSIQDQIDSGHIRVESNENNFSLKIDEIQSTDSGTYVLKAKNPIGEVSTQCQLNVLSKPKFVKPLSLATSNVSVVQSEVESDDGPIKKLSVNEKTQIKIDCQVSGNPKPSIKWFLNDEELKTTDKFKFETKQEMFAMTIKDCSLKEKGAYYVLAENSIGQVKEKIYLDINSIPSITKPLANTELVLQDNLTHELVFNYRSKPKADLTWLFADKPLIDDQSHYVLSDEALNEEGPDIYQAKLIIKNICLSDSGSYKCKVKNCAGEVSTIAPLIVTKAPVITKHLPETKEIVEKKELKIGFQYEESIPKSTISWQKDGNTLNASKRILISKPQLDVETGHLAVELTIPDPQATDCGLYTAKVANKVATVQSACNVNVLSMPKITKDLKQTIEFNEDSDARLDVTASGKPTPEFKWYFFNIETNSEQEIESPLTDGYTLLLNSIKKEQQGILISFKLNKFDFYLLI